MEKIRPLKGWPRGMNNILPDFALPPNTLRNAVNVDVLDTGAVRRRQGQTRKYTGTGIHSFWSDGETALFVENGELKLLGDSFSASVVHTGVGGNRMQYEEVNGEVYYTNGAVNGKIVNGVRREWGVEAPSTPPTLAGAIGILPAGVYQLVCTYVNDLGEESGCGRTAYIRLLGDGGISAMLPSPTSHEVRRVRVYMTQPNGDVLYEVADVPHNQDSILFSSPPDYGRACRTQFMVRTFPAEMMTFYRGRFYLVIDNVLWHTQPLAFGLIRPATDFTMFGSRIDMIKAVEDGIYLACNTTYFLKGTDVSNFDPMSVLPVGAARFSATKFPDSERVVWYSERGIVIGNNGGSVELAQAQNVLPNAYAQGSTLVRESNSLKQILSVVSGKSEDSSLAANDYMEAEVIRAQGR